MELAAVSANELTEDTADAYFLLEAIEITRPTLERAAAALADLITGLSPGCTLEVDRLEATVS